MRNPDQVLALLRGRWQSRAGDWLGGGGEWPLRVPLAPPGERQALAHWTAFDSWRQTWQGWHDGGLEWAERHWSKLGRQDVPAALSIADANALAALLGESVCWRRASLRFDIWAGRWPALGNKLRSQFALLADTNDSEFDRLEQMLAWLDKHPASNLFARQLPVSGMDSKWLETHTGLLGDWLRMLRGLPRDVDFWQTSGLRREPDRLRLRILDPVLRAHVGDLTDVHAPLNELGALTLPARHVFIVENKQTGLAFDDLPGAVVLMARGYGVEQLAQLSWLRDAAALHYWGDIDTHGLAILGRLRGHLPQARSLLMDEETLLAHRELWVTEPQPNLAERIEHLDTAEQQLYQDIRTDRFGVRVRLEQERINWRLAWRAIRQVACVPTGAHAGI